MKIKDGFMLRQIGAQTVVVAVGEASRDFNGIIRLNATGRFLWEQLQQEVTVEQLLAKMLETYDIDEQSARNDIQTFVARLKEADLLG